MNDKATRQSQKMLVKLLRFIGADGAAMTASADGCWLENQGRRMAATIALIDQAVATGLIADLPLHPSAPIGATLEGSRRNLALLPTARSFLRRVAAETEEAFWPSTRMSWLPSRRSTESGRWCASTSPNRRSPRSPG